MNAGALESQLADLSYHFYQAGEWTKALEYGRRAGERAQAMYSPQAAAEHYTRALEAAEHFSAVEPELLHARGEANETLGNFDGACDDYTRSLEAARLDANSDLRAEWRATLSLGWLWTGRDYARSGVLLEQALDLARRIDDPPLAHTLNRLGNWHVHQGHPIAGRERHEEALDLFRRINDRRGVAATLDLRGSPAICRVT